MQMIRICEESNVREIMTRNYRWSKISCVLKIYIICVGLCQDQCQQKCWKRTPDVRYSAGGIQMPNVTSEIDCKDLCANNGTCIGVDWGTRQGNSYGCWFSFSITPSVISNQSGVNHWDLVNSCSDECLSYCWKPLKNNSGINGAQNRGTMDENRCKLLCSLTTNCTGVDWVTGNKTCWLINFSGNITSRNGIHHWDIVKKNLTSCQSTVNSTITSPSLPPASPPTTTTSTSSARPRSVRIQVSGSTSSNVTTPMGRGDATDVTGITRHSSVTKDPEEIWKTVAIALAVLSGVFLVVIVALAVVLFRTRLSQRNQSSISNVREAYHVNESGPVKETDHVKESSDQHYANYLQLDCIHNRSGGSVYANMPSVNQYEDLFLTNTTQRFHD